MIIRVKMQKIKKRLDIIMVANPGLEKKDFWELEEILYTLLKKANLLQK